MNSVQVKVAEQITNLAPKVEDAVVAALTDRELTRRSDALVQALDKLDTMEKAFLKLGPDQITYDDKGVKTGETFSKARIDARNKDQGKINKLTGAITKALEKSDFNDLYNLAKNNNDQKQGGRSGDEEVTEPVAE